MPHAESLGVERDGCGYVMAGQNDVVDGFDGEGGHDSSGRVVTASNCRLDVVQYMEDGPYCLKADVRLCVAMPDRRSGALEVNVRLSGTENLHIAAGIVKTMDKGLSR